MILIDTSALVDVLTGSRRSEKRLRVLISEGHRIQTCSLVLFKWRRGPRLADEILDQENLFPSDSALPFGTAEALTAADLYKKMAKPHGREVDLAIAAIAIANGALLWTLNRKDFEDIPGLRLV
jgi:predicted nucleic acid-binding protein